MSEKGRTMLETMMVLAIIGVLTIFSLIGYRFAIRKHMANQAIKYVQVLAAGSRSWLGVKMANIDRSNEGLDRLIEDGRVLGDYQKWDDETSTEYATLPLERSPTEIDGFKLLPLDELISGVRVTSKYAGRPYFEIFDNARVSAMLTKDNDLVVNVEKMSVKECKQLITGNIDSDEIIAGLTSKRYIRCSATTYTAEKDCDTNTNADITLDELAEKICGEAEEE